MKLLVITQKVDMNDDVLGFVHNWLREFSKRAEKITVICLYKGEYDLPRNSTILSLGKEKKSSRFRYLGNFYRYIWTTRNDYDAVFVHMNDEYVLLGGLFWRLFGKKIYLWRNHIKGGWRPRIAVFLAHAVFSTTPYTFIARYKKNRLMPAGIDANQFSRRSSILREENSIFYFGRISPVKNIMVLIEAFKILKDRNATFHGYIIGDPPSRDLRYLSELKRAVAEKDLADAVTFIGGVPNRQAPEIYNLYEISANMTNSGSFDKTILESMACENIQLISNRSFIGKIDDKFIFNEMDAADLAAKAEYLLSQSAAWKIGAGVEFRQYAVRDHSLARLADELFEIFNSN